MVNIPSEECYIVLLVLRCIFDKGFKENYIKTLTTTLNESKKKEGFIEKMKTFCEIIYPQHGIVFANAILKHDWKLTTHIIKCTNQLDTKSDLSLPEYVLLVEWYADHKNNSSIIKQHLKSNRFLIEYMVSLPSIKSTERFRYFYNLRNPKMVERDDRKNHPINVYLLRDLQPRFERRHTNDGDRFVNAHSFDTKIQLRKIDGICIHMSDNMQEALHNLSILDLPYMLLLDSNVNIQL